MVFHQNDKNRLDVRPGGGVGLLCLNADNARTYQGGGQGYYDSVFHCSHPVNMKMHWVHAALLTAGDFHVPDRLRRHKQFANSITV